MRDVNTYFRLTIFLMILGITWFILDSTSTVSPVNITKSLSSFPHTIGEYSLNNSFNSSADVLELLGVDDYIQYNYVDNTNNYINLYVGFYRAVGVEGSYHSPKNCIPGGGWGIDALTSINIPRGKDGSSEVKISEMLIRRGSEYQVVLYWYQNRGRIIHSEYLEKIFLVLDAIFMGRRDGSFIRIMSYSPTSDTASTKLKLRKFAAEVMTKLEDYLPGNSLNVTNQ